MGSQKRREQEVAELLWTHNSLVQAISIQGFRSSDTETHLHLAAGSFLEFLDPVLVCVCFPTRSGPVTSSCAHHVTQPSSLRPGLEAQGIDWDEAMNVGKKDWKFDIFGKRHLRASGGRAGHMGGGIASIRRPNAIPPESGPTPQGLPSMYNRVKRI